MLDIILIFCSLVTGQCLCDYSTYLHSTNSKKVTRWYLIGHLIKNLYNLLTISRIFHQVRLILKKKNCIRDSIQSLLYAIGVGLKHTRNQRFELTHVNHNKYVICIFIYYDLLGLNNLFLYMTYVWLKRNYAFIKSFLPKDLNKISFFF